MPPAPHLFELLELWSERRLVEVPRMLRRSVRSLAALVGLQNAEHLHTSGITFRNLSLETANADHDPSDDGALGNAEHAHTYSKATLKSSQQAVQLAALKNAAFCHLDCSRSVWQIWCGIQPTSVLHSG
jgi:hypothetical protein